MFFRYHSWANTAHYLVLFSIEAVAKPCSNSKTYQKVDSVRC